MLGQEAGVTASGDTLSFGNDENALEIVVMMILHSKTTKPILNVTL